MVYRRRPEENSKHRDSHQKIREFLETLGNRLAGLVDAKVRAYNGYARGMVSEEAYRRVAAEGRWSAKRTP